MRVVTIKRDRGFKSRTSHFFEIDFLDKNCVTVDYPNDLLKIPEEVESVLLTSVLLTSYLRLPNYAVKRIVESFQDHVYKVEACVKEIT